MSRMAVGAIGAVYGVPVGVGSHVDLWIITRTS
jgi:hypothetical protein